MQNATELLAATAEGLERAAQVLRSGGLVAFPTETVYGLGGDARDDRAVARIFEAKGRPRFNPLIVHVPDLAAARGFAHLSPVAEELAAQFWPGPLTMVLPLREAGGLSPLVTAGLDTVAIRVPAHPLARALLQAFGGPLAAPSANPSGRVSPTRAAHVMANLSGRIDAVLDGGACAVGVESTIVAPGAPSCLLRPGGVSVEALEAVLGDPLVQGGSETAPNAPGQLASHYAPLAQVRLNVTAPDPQDFYIGFGPATPRADLTLSESGDLLEAAASLFHILRLADERTEAGQVIAFAPVPQTGLGLAINDRLRRAAAPRGQDPLPQP